MTARIGTLAGSSASSSRRGPKGPTELTMSGSACGRHAEQVEQLGGPLAGLDIHQLRARGIADLYLVLARQPVHDPGVHGAQA